MLLRVERRIASAKLLMAHTGKVAPVDTKTFTLELTNASAQCSTRWESRQVMCPS
jgi:hypothetical protein